MSHLSEGKFGLLQLIGRVERHLHDREETSTAERSRGGDAADTHHDESRLGRGELHQEPLVRVGPPHAQTLPGTKAHSQQPCGGALHLHVQQETAGATELTPAKKKN